MLILSFESSCDETSAAVVRMGESREILSNIIASSADKHAVYGGVVPEIASRAHIEAISGITYDALDKSGVKLSDIDAVGVTNRPGLIGALLVGVSFAKALAVSNAIPLVPVHHIRGHIAANYLSSPSLEPPYLALVMSGGHTSIIKVDDYTSFETVGRTRDDAIGEAFDKVGRILGLPYPGGAALDRLACEGDPDALKLPSAAINDATLDFSFSGLKTHVINYVNTQRQKGLAPELPDIAASFTRTVVESLLKKLSAATEEYRCDKLVIAGGVAANSHIRRALTVFAEKRGLNIFIPPLALCGDNAAMIGAQAYYELEAGNIGNPALNAYAVHN